MVLNGCKIPSTAPIFNKRDQIELKKNYRVVLYFVIPRMDSIHSFGFIHSNISN